MVPVFVFLLKIIDSRVHTNTFFSYLGFCVKCGPDEPGELVAKVIRGNMVSDFGGYSCKAESSKKIAKNVFAQGDVYFRSGDLLSQDELGYRYFKDRKGDTFR